MLFQTHDTWEVVGPIYQSIDPPGCRRFGMVEILLRVPIYIVEVCQTCPSEEISLWSQYLFTDFDEVWQFLCASQHEAFRMSLLLARHENSDYEYSVSTVTEAYAVRNKSGEKGRLFICKDGRHYVSDLTGDSKVFEMTLLFKADTPRPPED